MAAALSRNKSVTEYAPSRIKQAIAGLGSASKEQVAGVVCRTLHIEERPRRADATAGMAVALCQYYASSKPIERALGSERVKGLGGERRGRKRASVSWEKFLRENPEKMVK
jgi:crossover junction endodeoxyribonuclease RuvC